MRVLRRLACCGVLLIVSLAASVRALAQQIPVEVTVSRPAGPGPVGAGPLPDNTPSLPRTGFDVAEWVAFAVLLLLVGLALIWIGREAGTGGT